jgi:hypothetical protein
MIKLSFLAPARCGQPRDWRWPARAGVVLAIALPVLAASSGVAAATAPTDPGPAAPPPVTVVTPGADNHNGDIFVAPFGDQDTHATPRRLPSLALLEESAKSWSQQQTA